MGLIANWWEKPGAAANAQNKEARSHAFGSVSGCGERVAINADNAVPGAQPGPFGGAVCHHIGDLHAVGGSVILIHVLTVKAQFNTRTWHAFHVHPQ
jgi:hypothetical protein